MQPPFLPPQEDMLALPVSVGQALVNYLQERPHKEVWQLIQTLMSLQRLPSNPPGETDSPGVPLNGPSALQAANHHS